MSYQAIARKWRPQRFEEVVGQEAITKTLQNTIRSGRIHSAYIFSGPRGVGKTTLARIFAKALNCLKTDKPNPFPCSSEDDACFSCKEIAESRSIDVLEFDAASNTQVEKVRDLIIERVDTVPVRDRYKVFIIDEVHMLSTSSFNALLKTLEEPPPQVVFLMATTEIHRVPATILSRCQKFYFQTISTEKIFQKLKSIAEKENVEIEDEALWEIARAGEGSMRDALTSFDQVISFASTLEKTSKIQIEDVVTTLGRASSEVLRRTINAVAEGNPSEIISIVDEISRKGQNLIVFCHDLLLLIRNLLVVKISDSLIENNAFSSEELKKIGSAFTEKDLIRLFHSLSELQTRLRQAKEPRYQLEVGLVKLIEIRRLTPIEEIIDRLEKLEKLILSSSTEEVKKKSELTQTIEDLLGSDSLSTITSSDLEHVEISSLDSELEEILKFQGDDLKPLKNAPKITVSKDNSIDRSVKIPKPPKDASEEEIRKWVENHPKTALIKSYLGARLIKVESKR
ncbi:MAG: DNA polymerase III subunit gamma/tau [Pyrinomonadaceae bacterium]|nr:DNA polymerase III subunit gamma/tau [Pyrinomonadaceae bacterium]MCX7639190.1 DNA polymerase III subunit gamma/tau [Pyrinomonadaceae bacterium]MDW8303589.1 DNA polymerase III subunit gamma/tau [Acidobacteriota bacterium]